MNTDRNNLPCYRPHPVAGKSVAAHSLVALSLALLLSGGSMRSADALDGTPAARLDAREFGGVISAFAQADGRLYVASADRILAIVEASHTVLDWRHAEFRNTQLLAASERLFATLSDGSSLQVADTTTRELWTAPLSTVLPGGESVSTLALCGGRLLVGTYKGTTTVLDVSILPPEASGTTIDWGLTGSGDWMVTGLGCRGSTIYATLYDTVRVPSVGAVVSATVEADGAWLPSLVASLDGEQQSQRLVITEDAAYVMTATSVLRIDLLDLGVVHLPVAEDPDVYPQGLAVSAAGLFVLVRDETERADPRLSLSLTDLADARTYEPQSSVDFDYQRWRNAGISATDSGVYLVGTDQTAYLPVSGSALQGSPQTHSPTVAVVDAAFGSDRLFVARERSICTLSLASGALGECVESNAFLDSLSYAHGILVAAAGRAGLISVPSEGLSTGALRTWAPEEPYYSYVDATSYADGVVSLLDINPIRADKEQFRLEFLSIEEDATLTPQGHSDLRFEACRSARVAAHGSYIVVACGGQATALRRDDGATEVLRSWNLPATSTAIHLAASGVVAVGTTDGLQLYDLVTGSQIAVSDRAAGRSTRVVAVGESDIQGCLTAVYGDASDTTRDVVSICRLSGAEYDSAPIYRYSRARTFSASSLSTGPDGILLVTGSGELVYLLRARLSVAFIPVCW